MPRLLHRLGLFAAHHTWPVLIAWLAALIVVGALFKSVGANTSNNLELPGSHSQEATDVLASRFPPQQNGKNPIVFRARTGKVTDSANRYVDLATAITDKLFLVIVTVITLGFLVLLMAFRSWIVSTQAAVGNLLSVCAAFPSGRERTR